MKYMRIDWHNEDPAFPSVILYEIRDDQEIMRAVRYFPDGRLEYVSEMEGTKGAELPDVKAGGIDDYRNDEMFANYIAAGMFEEAWNAAKNGRRLDF